MTPNLQAEKPYNYTNDPSEKSLKTLSLKIMLIHLKLIFTQIFRGLTFLKIQIPFSCIAYHVNFNNLRHPINFSALVGQSSKPSSQHYVF